MRIKKKLKVKFNKIKEIDKDCLPFRILFENFNVKVVEDPDDADVVVEAAARGGENELWNGCKKTIIISGEDVFSKRCVFNLLESIVHRIFGNKKYQIMDISDKIIPKFISSLQLFYFLPIYVKYIKEILEKCSRNKYAIICNNIKNKNIFILPLFLQQYYSRMEGLIKRGKVGFFSRKKFCAFVVSSNSSRERVDFLKKLSKYKKVDSYGKVMNNMGDKIQKLNYLSNSALFKKYRFVICFENSFADEYITEKLPNVMFSGGIPIYRGAPNIGKYFNTESFINFEDYGSYNKMIEKIIELDQNDEKYKKFLRQPWFKGNKIPKIIKNKEKELIKFYKRILNEK